MSRAVLISIRPKWCGLIANGEKTVEIRKTRPKLDTPFKCYIYCTINGDALALPHLNDPKYSIHRMFNGKIGGRKMSAQEREKSNYKLANGTVIGEFVCDRIYCYTTSAVKDGSDISDADIETNSCLSHAELFRYEYSAISKENCIYMTRLYGWHISALQIYEEPKPLSSFRRWVGWKESDKLLRPPMSWCYVEELRD